MLILIGGGHGGGIDGDRWGPFPSQRSGRVHGIRPIGPGIRHDRPRDRMTPGEKKNKVGLARAEKNGGGRGMDINKNVAPEGAGRGGGEGGR